MQKNFDLLIRHATVIDGTGAPRYSADIGITGDRISKIGDLSAFSAKNEIDLDGRVAAPGFIDAHTHDDRMMLSDPEMTPKISQGVTTIIGGNCGVSLAPMPRPIPDPVTPPLNLLDDAGVWFKFPTFGSYLDALKNQPSTTNRAMLVGHTTLRVAVMDDLEQPASPEQIVQMQALVTEAMQAGAIGVSTGLFYEPAVAAPTQEVIDICRPLKTFNGLYCTHMRDEADGVMDSLEETFRIGREVGVPVVISHHKVIGQKNYGRSDETLAFIQKNMAKQPICLDCYPYAAGSTVLSWSRAVTSARVIVTWSKAHPEFAGQDLDKIADKMGVTQEQAVNQLLPAGAIYFRMDEGDVQKILQFGPTMIGSDGLPHDASPHPRLWATFPRVLGHYRRGLGLFSLETAVHKMTGLTATNFGLTDRGVIQEGAFADLTLFNEETVDAVATYENPIALSKGIETVIVNGDIVWEHGHVTAARPGRVLSRPAA